MRRGLSAIALMLTVGTAGCASHDDPKVATAGSGSPKPGAGTTAGGQGSELKYSQCMRDHGLAWYPDPKPDGSLGVNVPAGTDENVLKKAQDACKAYAPGANRNGRLSADDINKIRRVSQCVRDHGFPKYPDPDSTGAINVDSRTIGVGPEDASFRKAMQDCQKYLPPRKNKGGS